MEETLAFRALQQRNLGDYFKVLTIVQTIIYGFNSLMTAMGGEQPAGPDTVNDLLSKLRELLLPDSKDESADRAKKVKEMMENEINNGPFKVEAMVYDKKGKGLN